MDGERVARGAWCCALGAASLALGLSAFAALNRLARIVDRSDAIAILERTTASVSELIAALGHADATLWMRIVGALACFVPFVRIVRRRRLRCIAIAYGVALCVIVCAQVVINRRHATHTLCWAAGSGVYDRPTREHALDRGRTLLGTSLARMIGAFDPRAQRTCDDAARTLGR